ncbi:retrovirus-related pol polyprotein from transposon TNT 1-94 [Tanacetum coccineum]|uniref:Retrovirus-related pol polyprotein from transposon TNT 1-94 n=1 Tax=Tanacetum coccineum TaxID=301880 RepID=A0ABQ5DUL8_9ASTR
MTPAGKSQNEVNEIEWKRLAQPATVTEDDEMSKEKEIDKLMALISLSGTGYDNQRAVNVVGARENVGTQVVQKFGIQCYNCKEYGHVSKEYQVDWKDDTDDESDDQELEAHYMYMAHIQEVTPDPVDNSGPIFDDEPMHKELCAHQETISIMSQAKEAQIKLYKTREDKELDKVIALENKVKSIAKPEVQKVKRAHLVLYDIGCYNDNLALMLAPESDETIRLDKESRSKLSDLIRPFDYDQLNNLYDLFVPQREKSPEQHYFPRTSKMSHTSSNNEFSKESFRKQTTLLEKRMDESISWDQKGLHAQVTTVRTDKGTEFFNKTLHAYFAKEGIRHETSTARTPEQNGVVERRKRTLVEAARTMLSATKVPLFFWAEAIATACFTQNHSSVRIEKTKRSKNDQKPTRNDKERKRQEQDHPTAVRFDDDTGRISIRHLRNYLKSSSDVWQISQ